MYAGIIVYLSMDRVLQTFPFYLHLYLGSVGGEWGRVTPCIPIYMIKVSILPPMAANITHFKIPSLLENLTRERATSFLVVHFTYLHLFKYLQILAAFFLGRYNATYKLINSLSTPYYYKMLVII